MFNSASVLWYFKIFTEIIGFRKQKPYMKKMSFNITSSTTQLLKLTTTLAKYEFSNNVGMMLTFLFIEYSRVVTSPLSTKNGASKEFFRKCNQIHKKLGICWHIKKILKMKLFCAVLTFLFNITYIVIKIFTSLAATVINYITRLDQHNLANFKHIFSLIG